MTIQFGEKSRAYTAFNFTRFKNTFSSNVLILKATA